LRRLIDFLPSNNRRGVAELPSFDRHCRLDMIADTLIPTTQHALRHEGIDPEGRGEGDFFEISETFARTSSPFFGRHRRRPQLRRHQPVVLGRVLDIDASRKAARFVRFFWRRLQSRS